MNPQQQNMYTNSYPPLPPAAYPNQFSQMMQSTPQIIQPQHTSLNGTVPHQPPYEPTPQLPLQQMQYHPLPTGSTYPPQQGHYPQQIVRMSSTSEDESDDTQAINNISWQQTTSKKRKKISRKTVTQADNKIITNNRYSILTVEENKCQNTDSTNNKISKPPPIYIYGVTNYPEMVAQLRNCLEDEQYTTTSLANNTIKINCNIAENYRKLIRYLKEQNIIYHSYQLKEDRAYRVVIKHLHNSIPTAEIASELNTLGHKVRNIINVRHRATKQPLNLFFVDLEPANNNKDVYNIERLQNITIKIEPPHKTKNGIVQCTRCQLYGHSKSYCNRPFVCVKCGGQHSTESCKKSKATPATCALCGGDHPANYKGCEYYHRLIQGKQTTQVRATNLATSNNVNTRPNLYMGSYRNQNRTYSNVVNNVTPNNANILESSNNIESTTNPLTQFLNEFKAMFNQLIQQNSMVINMLTTLISKLVP